MKTDSSWLQGAWFMAGGGPARTGLFSGHVRLGRRPVRRLGVRGAVHASPVFNSEGQVFVADMSGAVQAFDRQGGLMWRRQLEGSISSSPAVDLPSGRLFVGTHRGRLYCLNCAGGELLWHVALPSRSDPRIASDLLWVFASGVVVASSWGGRFAALDTDSGQSQQTWDAGISPQAGASADRAGVVYFQRAVAGEGVICGRRTPDGMETVLHREPERERGAGRAVVAAAPVLDEPRGRVYFIVNIDARCDLLAWGLTEQTLQWRGQMPRMVVGTPAIRSDGAIVVAAMDGTLYAFGVDGSALFTYRTGAEYLLAGPVCDGDMNTYLPDPLGRLHVVDRTGTGHPAFEASRSFQGRPAFDAAGHLHVPGTDSCVRVWPNREAT